MEVSEGLSAGPVTGRVAGLDAFRGTAVLLMAVGNLGLGVRWVPAALKHAPDIGLTVADLVAPMFMLSLAFPVGLRVAAWRRQPGRRAVATRLARRDLMLIGIGAIITAGQALLLPGPPTTLSWGVLQAIGASSLLLLAVLFTPAWVRLVTGLLSLTLYQFLLDRWFLSVVLASSFDSLLGTLSWGGFLLIASVVAEQFRRTRGPGRRTGWLAVWGVVASGLGLALSRWFPISKNRASASFMLLTLGLCLLLFTIAYLALEQRPARAAWLQRIGRNPLALYFTHLLALGTLTLSGRPGWYADAPVWLTLLQAAGMVALLVTVSVLLERKGWVLRL